MHTLYLDTSKTAQWLDHFLISMWLTYLLIPPTHLSLKPVSILAALTQTRSPPGPYSLTPTCLLCSVFCTPQVGCLSSFPNIAALSFLPPSSVPCPGILSLTSVSLPSHWPQATIFPNQLEAGSLGVLCTDVQILV